MAMPKEKSTDQLLNEITQSDEIQLFLQNNKADLSYPSAAAYLQALLRQKHLKTAVLVPTTGLNRNYLYQIISGIKPAPSRPKLLAIALALRLDLEQTQHLLRYGQVGRLYPRDRGDSIVIYALQHGLSVVDTNELLDDLKLPLLE